MVHAIQAPRAVNGQVQRADVYARDSIPAYRYRLIGVYDDASGAPIDSVRVTDIVTGLSILTSKTGTATLIFLPEGGSVVRLRKIDEAEMRKHDDATMANLLTSHFVGLMVSSYSSHCWAADAAERR